MYTIKRECYNEKTFNGYQDNPYWRIEFSFYKVGLKDNGEFWSMIDGIDANDKYVYNMLQKITEECKLNINLTNLIN